MHQGKEEGKIEKVLLLYGAYAIFYSICVISDVFLKARLNTDTSPQNLWTTFLDNDLTENFKKSAVASAITIPLPLCFSCFVPVRRFRENLTKPFYFYLSRTCDSPRGSPSAISLALMQAWLCLVRFIIEKAWLQKSVEERPEGKNKFNNFRKLSIMYQKLPKNSISKFL